MRNSIQSLFNKFGLKIVGYPDKIQKRYTLILSSQKIDTILDIGANSGQFAISMRQMGYKGRIISFEPVKDAFDKLLKNTSSDTKWEAKQYALGDQNGKTMINVSGNSYSSSILDMLPEHVQNAPTSKYVAQEEIEVRTLDSVFDSICNSDERIMLKIDTQGFEKNVLDGGLNILHNVKMIELEMSLVPLYKSSILYDEIIAFLKEKGFELYSLEHVFSNSKTGQLLQVDGVFVREE